MHGAPVIIKRELIKDGKDMCDCIKQFNEKLVEKIHSDLEKRNEAYAKDSVVTEVQGEMLCFGGAQPGIKMATVVECSYRLLKKDGKPHKNKTKFQSHFAHAYCPFCGVKVE